MLKYLFLIIGLFGLLNTFSCKNDTGLSQSDYVALVDIGSALDSRQKTDIGRGLKYDLTKPEECVLSHELLEISGLTIDGKSDLKYAVNDEKAIIFALENCSFKSRFDFGKNGDYEGIEIVGDVIYVLKSNGSIVQYDMSLKEQMHIINTPLKSSNNTEGLGYDQKSNSLLIACKGSPNVDKHYKHKNAKAVYAYNLNTNDFVNDPLFVVKDEDIEFFFDKYTADQYSNKEAKRKMKRALKFSPSAISKNNRNSHYYLLSTVGKTLVVLNSEFEIVDLKFLDHPMFIQPEGICFNLNGDMFISNEGKGLVSNILKFPLQ